MGVARTFIDDGPFWKATCDASLSVFRGPDVFDLNPSIMISERSVATGCLAWAGTGAAFRQSSHGDLGEW